jgi:hypothetical protein
LYEKFLDRNARNPFFTGFLPRKRLPGHRTSAGKGMKEETRIKKEAAGWQPLQRVHQPVVRQA